MGHEDKREFVSEIKSMKKSLVDKTKSVIASGEWDSIDCKELGEAVDMIKDLAEVEAYCGQAAYYDAVVSAMETERPASDIAYRMGYDGPKVNSDYSVYSRMMNQNRDAMDDPRYGRAYNNFRKAKRYYTQTHTEKDREEMKTHTYETLADIKTAIRDMYDHSEPEVRITIKDDLSRMMGDLT